MKMLTISDAFPFSFFLLLKVVKNILFFGKMVNLPP